MWVCVWVWVWVCGGRGSSRSGAKEMMQPLSYLPPRPSLCRRRRRRARPAAALGRAACRGVGRPAAAAAVREPPSPQNRRSKEMTQPLSCRPACHLFGEGGGWGGAAAAAAAVRDHFSSVFSLPFPCWFTAVSCCFTALSCCVTAFPCCVTAFRCLTTVCGVSTAAAAGAAGR